MYFYINLYILFSILGYIFEEVLMILIGKSYNSSVLYGPWTSVYGISIYIMLVIYYLVKKISLDTKKEKIIYFFISSIILSLLEGITGILIEKTRHVIYWNYDKYLFNIGHYMCLEAAILWGILSIISTYYILPKIKKYIYKFPKVLTILILIMYIVDVLISCIK